MTGSNWHGVLYREDPAGVVSEVTINSTMFYDRTCPSQSGSYYFTIAAVGEIPSVTNDIQPNSSSVTVRNLYFLLLFILLTCVL